MIAGAVRAALLGITLSAPALAVELPPIRPTPNPARLAPPSVPEPGEPGLDPERFERAGFPLIGGNSDTGVQLGVAGKLTRFRSSAKPYLWNLDLLLSGSIKNDQGIVRLVQQSHVLRLDAPDLLGGRLRLDIYTNYQRAINAGYFGLGNATSAAGLPGATALGRRFQYLDLSVRARLLARVRTGTIADLALGSTLRYLAPEVYGGSKLAEDHAAREPDGSPRVRGVDSAGLGGLAAGVFIDTRDSEFVTSRGIFYQLGVGGTVGTIDAVLYGNTSAVLAHYVPIGGPFLFAARFIASAQFGRVPFYDLAQGGTFLPQPLFGGDSGIRGVPLGRYAGLVKVLTNLEIRTLLPRFRLLNERLRFGLTTFIDAGRLWRDYRYDPASDGTGLGLKYGIGGGTFLQWGEAAIFRFEAAYSPDAAAANPGFPLGVYVTDGLIF